MSNDSQTSQDTASVRVTRAGQGSHSPLRTILRRLLDRLTTR